jgi:LysR family glycine cleavage system transcriptional activator
MSIAIPIKALLAFDAAMKHNSFTSDANDMHVTAGAVGQQIQKLEEWLGTTLFTRSLRQVTPTT